VDPIGALPRDFWIFLVLVPSSVLNWTDHQTGLRLAQHIITNKKEQKRYTAEKMERNVGK